jgi:3-phenylpropionate/trans-cinnamate dioxygenase ferredoxin reductase component
VCVGGSYIASEVAASLTSLGRSVTMVMLEGDPLERSFGPEAARFFRRVLEEHGVEVIGGDEVARFEGSERVEAVITQGGRELEAQTVICGVGAIPDVMLARKSGLALGKLGGVLCDARLRASADGVFAAGDMCEYDSVVHGRFVRIEHEEVAAAQGRTVARNMLGADVPHDEVPYFFSDLSDWASLEYVGPAFGWDSEEIEGSIDDGAFAVWYREDGAVRAMLSVGGFGDLDRAREAIRAS